jgi:two-component system nitrogen regulation sensor histidine kinase NtrY
MMKDDRVKSTGLRGVIYITILLLLTAATVVLQIRFRGFEGPLSDNILIVILINANFLLLAAVVFMIARSLWKLSVEQRSKVPGAKFRTKLVAAFVSLAFIPTILLFLIGSGMFTRSFERLFSLRLENVFQDATSVAQAYYDRLKGQSLSFARQLSRQMTEERMLERFDPPVLKEYLARKAEEYGVGAVELFVEPRAPAVRVVTDQFPPRTFVTTGRDLATKAFGAEESASVSDLGRKGEVVRAVAPLYAAEDGGPVAGAVAVSYYVSNSLSSKAEEIRAGYVEYRSSFKGKEPIKLAYRLGFFAVTLAILLAAIWVALRVAGSITVPIGKLAEGTVEVASGNLDYRIEDRSGDEMGMLIDSFNRMTGDLKHSSERLRQEITNKETILANIDAGVVSIDRAGRITTINPAASKILAVRPEDVLDKRYDDALGFVDLRPVRNLFRKMEEGQGRAEEELPVSVRGRTLTLRMRISTLRDGSGQLLGSVITFDDLTELLRAKKAETWQDVARKIAHEVKNPLTPIKLSAERLRKKFSDGSADFDRVFDESSRTIVQQVDGLKVLLDEFSEFARMPRPNPVPQGLQPVVDSVIQLYAGAHKDITFVKDIPAGLPDLLLDQEQMKRVFINLFKNAVEVMEAGGTIWISARKVPSDAMVRIEVADNGPGISAEDVSRLFEPYFSRKKKGGGLGLAIVERIIADHNGSVHAEPNQPHGARFIIDLPSGTAQRA